MDTHWPVSVYSLFYSQRILFYRLMAMPNCSHSIQVPIYFIIVFKSVAIWSCSSQHPWVPTSSNTWPVIFKISVYLASREHSLYGSPSAPPHQIVILIIIWIIFSYLYYLIIFIQLPHTLQSKTFIWLLLRKYPQCCYFALLYLILLHMYNLFEGYLIYNYKIILFITDCIFLSNTKYHWQITNYIYIRHIGIL